MGALTGEGQFSWHPVIGSLRHAARVAERARTAGSAITVREALALDCMRGATIVAGADGDERRIRGVNVMEDADIVRWMRGGELLLTTGYSIREDPSARSRGSSRRWPSASSRASWSSSGSTSTRSPPTSRRWPTRSRSP